MSSVLVLCDCEIPQGRDPEEADILRLTRAGGDANLRCTISVLRDRLPGVLPDRLTDMLLIAAYVFAADTRVSRGTERDVFGEDWRRRFRFVMPVIDLEFWRRVETKALLQQMLAHLTGDEFVFEFVDNTERDPVQMDFDFNEAELGAGSPDTVVCFSGGMDSLAALLAERSDGRRPALVSHWPAPVIQTRQANVSRAVRERDSDWRFPHYGVWVNRIGGPRTVEHSQRSRSFLFGSLAVAVASSHAINRMVLADNGVVSINLPQSAQNVGTFLSRSTHPRYVRMLQEYARLVLENGEFRVVNTLEFDTRREVVQRIADVDPRLLGVTVSCAHVEGQTAAQPHCGTCSQCIDRRFSTTAAGLQDYDLPDAYEVDVFRDQLDEGDDRTHVENYVRFALKLEPLDTPDSLFEEYPELFEALPLEGGQAEWARKCSEMFSRHQLMVNSVLDDLLLRNAAIVRRGQVAADTLLGMILNREVAVDPRERYAERLQALLVEGLPPAFRTVPARNETHVQEVGQAVLSGAQQRLDRELPMRPFAGIGIKPDFANGLRGDWLYIEFKFPKERSRLNSCVTEMTSRVTIYRDQGAKVLFIVYDPNRTIADDAAFIQGFERHEGIHVGLSR